MTSLILTLLKGWIRLQFPLVPAIGPGKLAQKLADPTQPAPVLLDARSEAEYAVSHLAAAQHVPGGLPENLLSHLRQDTPLVVYCSVGYRSARVAQHLRQAGFHQVFNLEGGLFQWANEGRPMVRDGQPVQQVHPYNAQWGKLLKVESVYRHS